MDLQNILNFILVCLGMFVAGASYSLPTPIFPSEALLRGVTVSESGIVLGSAYLGTFVFTPFSGALIGKYGIKRIFLAGVFIVAAGNLMFGFLTYVENRILYFTLSFLIRLITAVGEAVICPVAYPLGSNQVAEENKGKAISVVESFFGIGTVFGPALGGWLFNVGGFRFPFWSFAAAGIVIWIVALLFLKNKTSENSDSGVREVGWREVTRCSGIGVYIIGTALGGSCLAWYSASLEPYLFDQFGLGSEDTGLVITANSITYTLIAPGIGFIIDMGFSPFNAVCLGSVTTMVSMLLLGPVPGISGIRTVPVVIISMIMMGFGSASSLIGGLLGLLEVSSLQNLPQSDKTHTLISSMWLVFFSLGSFIGAGAGSFTYDSLGFSWSCTFEAILLGMSVIFFSVVGASRKLRRLGYQEII